MPERTPATPRSLTDRRGSPVRIGLHLGPAIESQSSPGESPIDDLSSVLLIGSTSQVLLTGGAGKELEDLALLLIPHLYRTLAQFLVRANTEKIPNLSKSESRVELQDSA